MKYKTIYDNLIQKRQIEVPEGYSEEHHIIPRSLGGDNSKENLVRLTAREHYMTHYLLMKMQEPKSDSYFSMLRAFLMMQVQHGDNRYIPSHKFELLRKIDSERKSEQYKGSGNSSFGTMWICNPDTNVTIRINKTDIIPLGFVCGRNRKRKICPVCDSVHFGNYKTCSLRCGRIKNRSTKLTDNVVRDIRNGLIGHNMSTKELSKILGVSVSSIYAVRTGYTWNEEFYKPISGT